jgi:hypothetical protein
MLDSLSDLKDGHLYKPTEVAPFLPGNDPKRVRNMCASGELAHVVIGGTKEGKRYWIDGATVKAWRRRNTTTKAA